MILKNSELEIVESNPFENDVLGRKESAEILTQFISTANEPLVICIDAPWGQGKTTFLRMWQQHLKNEGVTTIYFNSWENDFTDDALVSILGEISSAIDNAGKSGDDDNVKKSLEKTKKIGLKFLKKGIPAFIKGLTYNTLDFEAGMENTIASLTEAMANDAINSYVKSKESLKDFREALSELANSLSSNDGQKKPLVFIIDELDRCRPTFAIEVLEKVKHFFNVENIIFVLGADKVQLGNSMKVVYGADLNVNGYLKRFIDFDYLLPQPEKGLFIKALFKKYQFESYFQLKKNHSETAYEDMHSLDVFTELFNIYNLSLREQEHCCSLLSLSIRTTPENHYLHPVFLCFLIVMKVNDPDRYKKFVSGELDADQILAHVRKQKGIKSLLESWYGQVLETHIIVSKLEDRGIREIFSKYEAVLMSDTFEYPEQREEMIRISEMLNRRSNFRGGIRVFESLIKKIEIASRFDS